MGIAIRNKKDQELVSSLFSNIFRGNAIIKGCGDFSKIAVDNLCKPFHNVVILPFSTFFWNHKGQEEGKF